MAELIAGDVGSIQTGAGGLSAAPPGSGPSGCLPSLGDPDADDALTEVSGAFARHAAVLALASLHGARVLTSYAAGFEQAGS